MPHRASTEATEAVPYASQTEPRQLAAGRTGASLGNTPASSQVPKHNVEFLRFENIAATPDEQDDNLIREDRRNGDRTICVARFRNTAIAGKRVSSFKNVRAHIIFRDGMGKELGDVFAAVWLNHSMDMIDLEVGKTETVVNLLCTLHRSLQGAYHSPEPNGL